MVFKGTRGNQYLWHYDKKDGFHAKLTDIAELLDDRNSQLSNVERTSLERFISNTSLYDEVALEPDFYKPGEYNGTIDVAFGGYDDTKYDALLIKYTYFDCKK